MTEDWRHRAADMERYVGEFRDLMELHSELVRRVVDRPELADEAAAGHEAAA